MSTSLPILQPRTCGDCMQCCKLLRITELNKPADVWCSHADLGRGCGIYSSRPQVCHDFECLWLQEECMPDELRPDKSHCVLWVDATGEILQVTVDPRYPEAYREGEMKRVLGNMYESMPNAKIGIIVGNDKFAYDPQSERLTLGYINAMEDLHGRSRLPLWLSQHSDARESSISTRTKDFSLQDQGPSLQVSSRRK